MKALNIKLRPLEVLVRVPDEFDLTEAREAEKAFEAYLFRRAMAELNSAAFALEKQGGIEECDCGCGAIIRTGVITE